METLEKVVLHEKNSTDFSRILVLSNREIEPRFSMRFARKATLVRDCLDVRLGKCSCKFGFCTFQGLGEEEDEEVLNISGN